MAELNFKNRTLYHGDNLPFLRGMNSETIHLIATDPPFNKGKDFHATPDSLAAGARFQDRWSWANDVEQAWVDQIKDDWPAVHTVIESAKVAYGEDMAAFLCFMGVRLMELRRLLRKDGSVYLHIDHTAHAWAKCLMDAIFGKSNFRNEIVWQSATTKKADAKGFGNTHETILVYSKTDAATWNPVYLSYKDDYIKKMYSHNDKDGRGPYTVSDLTQTGIRHGESGATWKSIDITARGKHWITPTGSGAGDWIVENVLPNFRDTLGTIARLEALDEHNLIYWPKRGAMPRLKRYLSSVEGEAATDMVLDIAPLQGSSKERTGYPTQKPLALYERIIKASSNEGDIVLDPFCGCATTLVAAEGLSRQWVGMDIWDGAFEIVRKRVEDNRQLLTDIPTIHYKANRPERTDGGMEAAPFIQVTERYAEPVGPRMSRAEMYEYLLAQHGQRCQGCDRVFDDQRYLELDHNTPRSDGGLNHITNRVLLCGPCNRAKSNTHTLSGLRRMNRANGWMVKSYRQTAKGGNMARPKKPRGRPPKYTMPEPLDVGMDTLAEVVLKAKPKDIWRYEQETGRSKPSAKPD